MILFGNIDYINKSLNNFGIIKEPINFLELNESIIECSERIIHITQKLLKKICCLKRVLGQFCDFHYFVVEDILKSVNILGLPANYSNPVDILHFLISILEGCLIEYDDLKDQPKFSDLLDIHKNEKSLLAQDKTQIISSIMEINNSNFSRPLIDGTANEEEAMDINKIVEILSEDMNNRLQILLTRLDITLESLLWKQETIFFPSQIWKNIRNIRNSLPVQFPMLSISDIFQLKYHLLYRCLDNSKKKYTNKRISRYVIGKVDDRGGRTNECRPTQLDKDPNYYSKRKYHQKEKIPDSSKNPRKVQYNKKKY